MADIPRCTYRLQLREGVGFAEAERLVPYLERLGVSHLYLAPPFKARSGSTHGYDVADANELDATLGGREGFDSLSRALKGRGMGLILDIVPNHMGIGPDNPWWTDVLEHGRESRHASFFDIDFERDPDGKLVLPVLGSPLDEVLEKGELEVKGGRLHYYDTPFPLAPGSADGIEGKPDAAVMRRLLDAQHYRLAFWRDGGKLRNYRRFFDIGELAGLRIEDPEVFEAAHALILDLVAKGQVQGLRVDHVDGLADPGGYLARLQMRCREVSGSRESFYVLVEKILSGDERLPEDWAVSGTTGYEFMNQVLGLLIDPDGLPALERLRAEITGESEPFPAVVDRAKRLVLEVLFPGEHRQLAERADRLLPDLGVEALKAALTELLVAFPVYRTYRTMAEPLSAADRAVLDRAFAAAGERGGEGQAPALKALRTLFEGDPTAERQAWLTAFQQLSGPVMAKSLEDTAFYRFPRLLALNEVGGEPDAHGVPPERFHAMNAERLASWPHNMLGTATHDTKRGEDTRARLAVLSELPDEWAEAVRGWRGLNAAVRPEGLHPKDEYTLYQALVGVWPGPSEAGGDEAGLAALRERVLGRVRDYLTKALREGKERSSWLDQDGGYEEAALGFAGAILDPSRSHGFLGGLQRFVARISPAGHANALAQLLLKLTSPGVPDVYQGTELWDLSFVDPDNRRPVDWDRRAAFLGQGAGDGGAPSEEDWASGLVKQRVLVAALAARRELPDLFAEGEYLPLGLEGGMADHAFAFARRKGEAVAITVVGRRLARFLDTGDTPEPPSRRWGDTVLVLPEDLLPAGAALEDRLTGARTTMAEGGRLPLREVLGRLPVALLTVAAAG